MVSGKISVFKCRECGEILDSVLREDHTKETDHKEFKPLYKEAQPKE